MLKIKDNVDLKILEKYGFRFNNTDGKYYNNCGNSFIEIPCWNRIITLKENSNQTVNNSNVICLYDLIKADLVEKVEV